MSLDGVDWDAATAALDAAGCTAPGPFPTPDECGALAAEYNGDPFRSTVVMARHGFGRGEYKYFAYPLPPAVAALRARLCSHLAPVANCWHEAMGLTVRFQAEHSAFLARCRVAGQTHPTPLLLRYGPGDFKCLQQDLYGEHVFPLQVAVPLSEPGRDFTGGEFVLTEQRPRMQSRAEVVALRQGEAAAFAIHQATGRWHARQLPRHDAARGQPDADGATVHLGRHLP